MSYTNPKTIAIFGSTGSVGTSVLDLIRHHPENFSITVLTAHKNIDLLLRQAKEFNPQYICIADENSYKDFKEKLGTSTIKLLCGSQGLIEAAQISVDIHIAAIVGFAGLRPMIAGIPYTSIMAIANKEPLVSAGPLVKELACKHNTKLLPIDSEHSAIYQVFEKDNSANISKLYLTASGGPFRTMTVAQCEYATVQQAINHPNWSMGTKISIDSATMMNKALEIIEAHELFDMPSEKIDVLLHPQSIIHSMVEYDDGSVLAQLGASDMRTPIAHVLAYPHRIKTSGKRLSWQDIITLDLSPIDVNRFPAISLARFAIEQGLSTRIAMNAANEVLIEAFIHDEVSFGRIVPYIEEIITNQPQIMLNHLDDICAYDHSIRCQTTEFISKIAPQKKAL
jgi:1-deoxy-D-xylulose-5-phosphate reductoisomerase